MASWVTHLIIADEVLKQLPELDRRGFCVGSIAPDCNVENADWSDFTPPKAVTHWMSGSRKKLEDAERFFTNRVEKIRDQITSAEEYAFLLGYYAHLITDAAYEKMARNEERVRHAWERIEQVDSLRAAACGMEKNWDSIKTLLTRKEIKRSVSWFEADYLQAHPDSGYLTEILSLREFPNYLDYLMPGCIVRKIGVMGGVPVCRGPEPVWLAISREEYEQYIADCVTMILERFRERKIN